MLEERIPCPKAGILRSPGFAIAQVYDPPCVRVHARAHKEEIDLRCAKNANRAKDRSLLRP